MNQILSVEMSKQKSKKRKTYGDNKASTKSVVLFFCIALIIFGIALTGMGVYGMTNKPIEVAKKTTDDSIKPRIDITQNASEIDIEISGKSKIVSAEYSWNDGEIETIEGNGTTVLEKTIQVPSGTQTLKITAKDDDGNITEYSKEYVGPKEPKSVKLAETEGNKLKVICKEEQQISYIAYYYDDEEEKRQDVNKSNEAEIEIETKEGKHTLTIKVGYADGTTAQKSSKLYVPTASVTTDGNNFIIKASDERIIAKVNINFNNVTKEKEINQKTFELKIPLKEGENRIILTVYNKDGSKIVKKVKWEKK